MKIAIDIDDEDYKRIQGIPDVFNSLTSRAYSAIRNGASLPDTNVGDLISRQAVVDVITHELMCGAVVDQCGLETAYDLIKELPSVEPERKTGHCKECKYFEYDSLAKVDGIPLIVAHEICKRWGDGCKTSEDGYCFLYEPRKSEVDG